MPDVNIDFVGVNGGQGEVANLLSQSKLDPSAMRPYIGDNGKSYITVFKGGDAKKLENYKQVEAPNTNATLRPYEWRQLDEVLLPISESRLNGVQDLISNGLVYNLGNAMGTTVLEWHDVSDALDAELSMTGISKAENDRQEFTPHYLPIPIIHADYQINARALEASRRMGNPLDVSMAERAVRKVSDKLEKMLFTDTSYQFGGGTIFSYTNYTYRNKVTLGTHWDHSGVTGKMIVDDVLALKQASIEAYHFGPWMLYIPVGYETILDTDYSTSKGNNTIRERIKAIAGIKDVKVVDTLAADNVVLVQMTSDVVRLVRGLGIQNVQWDEQARFVHKFKVLTIAVPQIRSDASNHCGVTHGTF